ncbi:MAG: Uma2 family endonuclease [Rhodocyclaceae bacterium]|nr:Uma2 family endonuclease [Rhodocyclaceae bacterium]MBX3666984.1 Uma2 family endonuclease [Rhodocyclaceae bacterium]
MNLPKRDFQFHTYAEYCTWPDDQRYELIDGVAYAMNAPNRMHQEFVGELYFQIAAALRDRPCRIYVSPFDVRLPRRNEADEQVTTVLQPDLLIVCDPSKLDERGCRGAPDWVAEILSPATASYDHILKRSAYEAAGVGEYWLVHPVDRMLTVYRLEHGRYGIPQYYELSGRLALGVLPEVEVDWEQLFVAIGKA